MDLEKIGSELNNWYLKVQEFGQQENVKALAKVLPRDFVVLVRQVKYDPSTKKFLANYENVNVLVGPKETVEKLKALVESLINGFNGSFTTVWRVQGM